MLSRVDFAAPWILLGFLLGCEPSSLLVVQVRSDLEPGEAFVALSVESLDGARFAQARTEAEGRDWAAGVRVLEATLDRSGPARLRVAALDIDEQIVVSRDVQLDAGPGVTVVTVLLTADCVGVVCDSPEAPVCLGSRCVSATCFEERLDGCGEPECATTEDCPGAAACATRECTLSGVCLATADVEVCGEAARCVPDLGCRALADEPSVLGSVDLGNAEGVLENIVSDLVAQPSGHVFVTGRSPDALDLSGFETSPRGDGLGEPGFVVALDRELNLAGHVSWADGHSRHYLSPAVDGGVYALLPFWSSIDLDGTRVDSLGGRSLLFARLADDAHVRWARALGSSANDSGAVGADPRHGVVVAMAAGSATVHLDEHTALPPVRGGDLVLGFFSADSDQLEASYRFGADDARARQVALAPNGDAYISGHFAGQLSLDPEAPLVTPRSEMFLTRISPAGEPVWATVLSRADVAYDSAMVVLPSGDVALAGDLYPGADLGRGEMRFGPEIQAFVAVYGGADGRLIWAQAVEASGGSGSDDLAVGPDGSLYLAGQLRGRWDSERGSVQSAGDDDGFVAGYAPDGALTWVWAFGGSGEDHADELALSDLGGLYVAGHVAGPVELAGGVLAGQPERPTGFVTRLLIP